MQVDWYESAYKEGHDMLITITEAELKQLADGKDIMLDTRYLRLTMKVGEVTIAEVSSA
jgi:hypothetical protein